MNIPLDADEARRLLAEFTPAAEHTVLARALRAVVALSAVVDGRETPPTEEESRAHYENGGSWLMLVVIPANGAQRELVTWHHGWGPVINHPCDDDPRPLRWMPIDADRKPCPWPKVAP